MTPEGISDDPDYRADFFDRSGDELRCRPCGFVITHLPREWMDARIGDRIPCPNCSLDSRIPTLEESEWPDRKHPHDPMKGVPVTERERAA